MHELAFTEGIIKIVNSEKEKQGFTRCLKITMSIGDFCGIVPACVEEFFPLAAKGSSAEGAELIFNKNEDRFGCFVESIEVE